MSNNQGLKLSGKSGMKLKIDFIFGLFACFAGKKKISAILFLFSILCNLSATVTAPYLYLPQEYQDYFYNVLTKAIRERCAATGDTAPQAYGWGWYDAGDTVIREGASGWQDKANLIPGKNICVYFRDANGNGICDSGEYVWQDTNNNHIFDFGTDKVLSGTPAATNNKEWGKQKGLFYFDENNNGQLDDNEAVWKDNSSGILNDMQAFHSTISSLIPGFVNHTDNGGNWDGQTTIPNWTEATILTSIGDASRLAISQLSPDTKAWFVQQYKILNLLKWTQIHYYYGWHSGYYSSRSVVGAGFTWSAALADAISKYNAQPWDTGQWGNWGDCGSAGLTVYYSGMPWIPERPNLIYLMASRYYLDYENKTPFDISLTVYGYTYSGGNPYIDFINKNSIAERWYSITPEISITANSICDYGYIDNWATQNIPLSIPGAEEGYAIGRIDTDYFYILKFDGANGFTPLPQSPTTDIPVATVDTTADTNRDDIVDVGADIDSFGGGMGTVYFEPERSEPQIFIPLAVSQWDQLPVHAYIVQGGHNYFGYNYWTHKDADETGMLQTYSLHTRGRIFYYDSDNHIKQVEIIRPRGNSVIFDFPWDGTKYSEVGFPTGINKNRTYVLSDNTPTDHTDLEFQLHFDSGIIHSFDTSGLISRISHIDGRYVDINSMNNVSITLNENTVTTPQYNVTIKWENGHLKQANYQTKDTSETVTSELGYGENKKIVSMTNSKFPELSTNISENSISFSSGVKITKNNSTISTEIPGSGILSAKTVFNENNLPSSIELTANNSNSMTTYDYISDTGRYSNGSPKWSNVSKVIFHDGSTKEFEYAADTGWISKANTTRAGMICTLEYGYENTTGGEAKNTSYLLERPRKIEEKTQGTTTALSLFSYSGTSTTETKSLDSSRRLTYTSVRKTYGPPDKSTPIGNYTYISTLGNNILTVALTNSPEQQTSERIVNSFGSTMSEKVFKNSILVSSANSEADSFGRITKTTYLDGTKEEFNNYCLYGPREYIDRNGNTFTYKYDASGRLSETTTPVAKISWTYDALGNKTSETKIPNDGSETFKEYWTHDAIGRVKSHTDAVGTTNYAYEGPDTKITYPDGTTKIIDKNLDGSTKSISGSATTPVSYEYGVDPTKGRWSKEINGTTWSKTFSNMLGQAYRTEYSTGYWQETYFDAKGRSIGTTDSEGRTSSITYNSRNEVESETSNGVKTDYAQSVVEKDGKTAFRSETTLESDLGTIKQINENSVDGFDSWTSLNGRNTESHSTLLGEGRQQTVSKDFIGRTETVTSAPDVITTDFNSLTSQTSFMDCHGRTTKSLDSLGNGIISAKYRTGTSQMKDRLETGDAGALIITYLENSYNPKSQKLPDNSQIGFTFNQKGSLEEITGNAPNVFSAKKSYDELNRVDNLATTGAPGTANTRWVYNQLSGLPESKLINGKKVAGFTYHPDGRLASFSKTIGEGTEVTQNMSYTPPPQLFPSGYSWSDGTSAISLSGQNTFGQPATISTDNGNVCKYDFEYNSDSQIKSASFTSPITENNSCSYEYNNKMLRSKMTSGKDAVDYQHDESGRLVKIISGNISAQYEYVDGSFNMLAKITVKKDDKTVLVRDFSYEPGSTRIKSLTNSSDSGNTFKSFTYEYNPSAKIAKTSECDNTEWRYTYDGRGQISSATRFIGFFKTADFAYKSDSISNLLEGGRKSLDNSPEFKTIPALFNSIETKINKDKVEVSGSVIEDASVTVNNVKPGRNGLAFFTSVDANNQASASQVDISVVAALFDKDETPELGGDKPGNEKGSDIVNTITASVFMPKKEDSFTYDLGGRLLENSQWKYSWNSDDRLISAESRAVIPGRRLEFSYDHAGRRIKKSVFKKKSDTWVLDSESFFYYDSILPSGTPSDFGVLTGEKRINHETNETSEFQYLWGLDLNGTYQGLGGVGGLIAVIDKTNGKTYLPCSDAKGTIHSYIDSESCAPVATFAYDPYGRIISSTIAPSSYPLPLSLLFQSKYYDSETGLYYFGFRYYDPGTGRWLNRDPLGEDGGYNLYAFCNNDPVNGIDPLGLALYAFDGTANCPTNEDDGVIAPTNVYLLFRAYKTSETIFSHYIRGVGNDEEFSWYNPQRYFGKSNALGANNKIEEMYNKVIEFYNKKDREINIIGFSRGAVMAVLLAEKIEKEGIPIKGTSESTFDSNGYVYHTEKRVYPKINSLGLFDPVPGPKGMKKPKDIPESVNNTFITYSLHEGRGPFQPLVFTKRSNITYAGFVGDHSDNGGSWKDRGLSNLTLFRMNSELRSFGVYFDTDKLVQMVNSGNTSNDFVPHRITNAFPLVPYPRAKRNLPDDLHNDPSVDPLMNSIPYLNNYLNRDRGLE